MALEAAIVEWSRSRPAWQRAVLRRISNGHVFSEQDYDQLTSDILAGVHEPNESFELIHLPQVASEDPPVMLVSISKPLYVNALASSEPLTFSGEGITIVYGDNGSGKSGYARLLKRIARSRHQEEVLSNVFRDSTLAQPTASLEVKIDHVGCSISWPEETPPALQRILFYDADCGSSFISTASDFPYRPSALFVMEGLIEACTAVRNRVDSMLEANSRTSHVLPSVPDELTGTDVGKFLIGLNADSSVPTLDLLIRQFDEATESIEQLSDHEARLRNADPEREKQSLKRQSEKLASLNVHLEHVRTTFSHEAILELEERRSEVSSFREAARSLSQAFNSEPLAGVGTSAWEALWESARKYSEDHAYPMRPFPQASERDHCVLCQQPLQPLGSKRLLRFESFVRDDIQTKLQSSILRYEQSRNSVCEFIVVPEIVDSTLADLSVTHDRVVSKVRDILDLCVSRQQEITKALEESALVPRIEICVSSVAEELLNASQAAETAALALSDPYLLRRRIFDIAAKRREFELLRETKKDRENMLGEIERLKKRRVLESIKSASATGPVTNKILELSEESITELVRDAFTRETERLRLDRVTIARTKAEKGALLHQPKLVGARQPVALTRVFSEGEQTALGIAAFLTEVHLDSSRSAVILDDPVTSLDHIRRALVATRLAEIAETRQVVVFTHDVAFVSDLKREASARSVTVTERCVTRSRAGDRSPGACGVGHPWKAKDVSERLNELRADLARIMASSTSWDDRTHDEAVAGWAGKLSETWERIFSQEIVGQVLAEGGLEVRPRMVRILAKFSDTDLSEFEGSYSHVSQWAKRHDKSAAVNYVSPEVPELKKELDLVDSWFRRVKGYKN